MAIATAHCVCEHCGKEFVVRATRSNRTAANEFEAWAENNITVCHECERAEATAQAKANAGKAGLPQLVGSDKQIDWAVTIRDQFVLSCENYSVNNLKTPEQRQAFADAIKAVTNVKTRAKWWIDLYVQRRKICFDYVVESIYYGTSDEDNQLYEEIKTCAKRVGMYYGKD